MAQLGDNLQRGTVWHRFGITYACGWYNNKVWLAASSQADLEREALDGTNYLIEVCEYTPGAGEDPPRSCGMTRDDGSIWVVVEQSGTLVTYASSNLADGFSEV